MGNHRFRVQSFHPGTDVGVSCDFSLLVEFCYDFYDWIVKCITGSFKVPTVVYHDGLQVRAPRAPTSVDTEQLLSLGAERSFLHAARGPRSWEHLVIPPPGVSTSIRTHSLRENSTQPSKRELTEEQ